MSNAIDQRIPEEILAETWFSVMHELLEEVRAAFEKARQEGVTQEDLAKRIGRDPAFVSRCLRGEQNMTVRTLNNIARALDCRLNVKLQSLTELQPSNRRPKDSWRPEISGFAGVANTKIITHSKSDTAYG